MQEAIEAKQVWRRRLQQRDPVTPTESAGVARSIREWLSACDPSAVLVYLPMPGEVDITGVVDRRHRWFVTRTPGRGAPLTVHSHDAPRERHRFGYEQPVAGTAEVDPAVLDIVLTPGLGFDATGTRLGWGMGYYDGLFASTGAVVAVGVVTDRLVVDGVLPFESHDRRMDFLATESGVRPVQDA